MTITAGTRVDHFQWVSCSAPEGWARSTAPTIRGCRGRSRSRCSPRDSAGDPDRLRRFEQEALAVARLAHPNILAVHDIGAFEGSPYLVTELLEGETLRETMNERRLSSRKALDCARQVAEGLAAAHEHGIVHRDIKPENLFVTKEGRVKILDFGIAKLTDLEGRRARRCDVDRARPRARRNGCLHVARAGARRSHRLPFGPVQPGRRALRDGRRCLTVPPRHRCRNDDGHPP